MNFKELVQFLLEEEKKRILIRHSKIHGQKIEAKDYQPLKKAMAVEKKGGKCSRCGYDKSLAALHFHHNNKSFADLAAEDNAVERKSITAVLGDTPEGRDLQLLCANCHAEVHFGMRKAKDFLHLQKDLLDKKEIEKTKEESERIISLRDKITDNLKEVLSPAAYKKTIDVLKNKADTGLYKQSFNDAVLKMLFSEKNENGLTLKDYILKQRETIVRKGDKEIIKKFDDNIKKIENAINELNVLYGKNEKFSFNLKGLQDKKFAKKYEKQIQKMKKKLQ